MIWAFAVAAVATLYLALRFRRFQSWVEPVLTIAVAIGLAAAILVWFVDERAPSGGPTVETTASPALEAADIALSDLAFSAGQTKTSYQVKGRLTNRGAVPLQSFRLDVALSDCPDGVCREVGRDSALIVQRVLPGETQDFTTFAVFPGSELRPVAVPQWEWSVREPRAYR